MGNVTGEWRQSMGIRTKKTDLSDVNGMIGSKLKLGNHSQTQTAVTALSWTGIHKTCTKLQTPNAQCHKKCLEQFVFEFGNVTLFYIQQSIGHNSFPSYHPYSNLLFVVISS
jgi:hypothetical protein